MLEKDIADRANLLVDLWQHIDMFLPVILLVLAVVTYHIFWKFYPVGLSKK